MREERELETVLQGEKRFYLLVRVSDEEKVTSLAKGKSVKEIVLHGKCVLLILGRLPEGGRHAMGTYCQSPRSISVPPQPEGHIVTVRLLGQVVAVIGVGPGPTPPTDMEIPADAAFPLV